MDDALRGNKVDRSYDRLVFLVLSSKYTAKSTIFKEFSNYVGDIPCRLPWKVNYFARKCCKSFNFDVHDYNVNGPASKSKLCPVGWTAKDVSAV